MTYQEAWDWIDSLSPAERGRIGDDLVWYGRIDWLEWFGDRDGNTPAVPTLADRKIIMRALDRALELGAL